MSTVSVHQHNLSLVFEFYLRRVSHNNTNHQKRKRLVDILDPLKRKTDCVVCVNFSRFDNDSCIGAHRNIIAVDAFERPTGLHNSSLSQASPRTSRLGSLVIATLLSVWHQQTTLDDLSSHDPIHVFWIIQHTASVAFPEHHTSENTNTFELSESVLSYSERNGRGDC